MSVHVISTCELLTIIVNRYEQATYLRLEMRVLDFEFRELVENARKNVIG